MSLDDFVIAMNFVGAAMFAVMARYSQGRLRIFFGLFAVGSLTAFLGQTTGDPLRYVGLLTLPCFLLGAFYGPWRRSA